MIATGKVINPDIALRFLDYNETFNANYSFVNIILKKENIDKLLKLIQQRAQNLASLNFIKQNYLFDDIESNDTIKYHISLNYNKKKETLNIKETSSLTLDCSIAVATPKGLVTPVVRNAESLSVLEVEAEIARLGKKARDGKLTLEDMSGGTFTISNGGVFGSLYGTPIINMPQTAVLGLHGIKERPVTVNGQIVSRPMMYLALTYDHRLLDGREAVTFLRTVKELIEDPRKMLLM